MIQQEQKIYQLILQLAPNVLYMTAGEGQKSTVPDHMDLHLDCLYSKEKSRAIALSHYFKENGDCVPDPDMEIILYPHQKRATPYSFKNACSSNYIHKHENRRSKKRREFTQFLRVWLENCLAQGHHFD